MKYKNLPKTDWISPSIEVKETATKGKGMFAIKDIKLGDTVIIWGGNYVTGVQLKKMDLTGMQVMQWDEDLYSVEGRGESEGYFINHSCDSNTWMDGVNVIIARKDIDKGEEITIDYALFEFESSYVSKWKCECGFEKCRKTITGNDWKQKEIQERYKGHFSPMIEFLIKKQTSK